MTLQAGRAARIAAMYNLKPRDLWGTPRAVFREIDAEFGVGLDAAAVADDALVCPFISPEDDGLKVSWMDRCVLRGPGPKAAFANPPYSACGGGLLAWMEKAVAEAAAGLTCILLVPPSMSTRYMQLAVECGEVRVYRSRLAFLHPVTGQPVAGNRGDSCLAILRPGLVPVPLSYIDAPGRRR